MKLVQPLRPVYLLIPEACQRVQARIILLVVTLKQPPRELVGYGG